MTRRIAAVSAFALVLTACAQPEPEPEPVYLQPSYDKIGNASCPGGYRLATTEAGDTVCAPL